jgi:hypothetical protein
VEQRPEHPVEAVENLIQIDKRLFFPSLPGRDALFLGLLLLNHLEVRGRDLARAEVDPDNPAADPGRGIEVLSSSAGRPGRHVYYTPASAPLRPVQITMIDHQTGDEVSVVRGGRGRRLEPAPRPVHRRVSQPRRRPETATGAKSRVRFCCAGARGQSPQGSYQLRVVQLIAAVFARRAPAEYAIIGLTRPVLGPCSRLGERLHLGGA